MRSRPCHARPDAAGTVQQHQYETPPQQQAVAAAGICDPACEDHPNRHLSSHGQAGTWQPALRKRTPARTDPQPAPLSLPPQRSARNAAIAAASSGAAKALP